MRKQSQTTKPPKPYPDFPLFAHDSGQWGKKIGGKFYYFGTWDDPQGALKAYLEQKDHLQAAKMGIVIDVEGMSTIDAVNHFLTFKKMACESGEITQRTYDDYIDACKKFIDHFGRSRTLQSLDLSPEWASYRTKLAEKYGRHRFATRCCGCASW